MLMERKFMRKVSFYFFEVKLNWVFICERVQQVKWCVLLLKVCQIVGFIEILVF